MKSTVLILLAGALTAHAATVTQDVIEGFEGPDYSFNDPSACLEYWNCSTKPLPFPGDGLKYNNLYSHRANIYQLDAGLSAIDPILLHDVYLALWNNTNTSATITKKYAGSRVKAWELHAIDFGCTALQDTIAGQLQNSGNCTLLAEGLNRHGECVASETFKYIGKLPQELSQSQYYIAVSRYSTTEGGLKGKKFATLKLTATYDGGLYPYLGDTVFGIDTVNYTLYNKTSS